MKLVWLYLLCACALVALSPAPASTAPGQRTVDTWPTLKIRSDSSEFANEAKYRDKKSTNPVGCVNVAHPQYTLCSDGEAVVAAAPPPHLDALLENIPTQHKRTPNTLVRGYGSWPQPQGLATNQLSYQPAHLSLPTRYDHLQYVVSNCGGASIPQVNDYLYRVPAAVALRQQLDLERKFSSARVTLPEVDFPQSRPVHNLVPTLPLWTGQEVRTAGGSPSSGGCGPIPLFVSCRPNIVQGSLVHTGTNYGGVGLGYGYGSFGLDYGEGLGGLNYDSYGAYLYGGGPEQVGLHGAYKENYPAQNAPVGGGKQEIVVKNIFKPLERELSSEKKKFTPAPAASENITDEKTDSMIL